MDLLTWPKRYHAYLIARTRAMDGPSRAGRMKAYMLPWLTPIFAMAFWVIVFQPQDPLRTILALVVGGFSIIGATYVGVVFVWHGIPADISRMHEARAQRPMEGIYFRYGGGSGEQALLNELDKFKIRGKAQIGDDRNDAFILTASNGKHSGGLFLAVSQEGKVSERMNLLKQIRVKLYHLDRSQVDALIDTHALTFAGDVTLKRTYRLFQLRSKAELREIFGFAPRS